MFTNPSNVLSRDVRIPLDGRSFDATLSIPESATGLVIFAHGSGSSRFSTRNRAVAGRFQDAGLATLLVDLLTAEEEQRDEITAEYRFDIARISHRVVLAIQWARSNDDTRLLDVGLFGASTGAAAALVAAAELPSDVSAVVSRGGRPDLAGPALQGVRAPTLLIVGACDVGVLELNREAARRMKAHTRIDVVPGATHLFEEAGALTKVAESALAWFQRYLGPFGVNHLLESRLYGGSHALS